MLETVPLTDWNGPYEPAVKARAVAALELVRSVEPHLDRLGRTVEGDRFFVENLVLALLAQRHRQRGQIAIPLCGDIDGKNQAVVDIGAVSGGQVMQI